MRTRQISITGTLLEGASVTINGTTIETGEKGGFTLRVSPAPQYIVTIKKRGYGLFSRVYTKGVERRNWTLSRATWTTLDPRVGGIVQDTQAVNCLVGYQARAVVHLLKQAM